MALQLRALNEDERIKIDRLTHAQTAPVQLARRARLIALSGFGLWWAWRNRAWAAKA